MDDFNFDKQFKKTSRLFGLWFLFCALLALAVLAGLGWGGYQLIEWIKTK